MKTVKTMEKERETFAGLLESETADKETLLAMYDDANADRIGLQENFDAFIENVLDMCGENVVKACGSASALAEKRAEMKTYSTDEA